MGPEPAPAAPEVAGRRGPRARNGVAVLVVVAVAALVASASGLPNPLAVAGPDDGPSATASSAPTLDPGIEIQDGGLWRSPEELAELPITGGPWQRLEAMAADGPGRPTDVSDQDSEHGLRTMAVALVAARLDRDADRAIVRDAIDSVIDTESGETGGHGERNRILGVGRNLASYVIAADLIDLRSFDRPLDDRFRTWLRTLMTEPPTSANPELTLPALDQADPGNWGAYAGASRAAAALYLGDPAEVQQSADALRRYVGDGIGFTWRDDRDLSWASDPAAPTPINPAGASRDGNDIGGIIVADMRRGDGYRWPPTLTRYPREALVGRSIQAELLARAGYPAFEWGDRGLLRGAQRILALDGLDDEWYEPVINAYWLLDARFGGLPLEEPATGRTVAGVDWTHPR